MIQLVIAILILVWALVYLVHKLIFPLPFLASGKNKKESCGEGNCGCS